MINSVVDLKCVWNMSLKPGSDDTVFAVVRGDNILRIFDIRSSTSRRQDLIYCSHLFCASIYQYVILLLLYLKSEPVLQTAVQQPTIDLGSVMFSPVESNLIAAAGTGGTRIFDIRHNQIGYIPINSTLYIFVAVILKTIYVSM